MKAKCLIEELLKCGPEVDVEIALEHINGGVSFYRVLYVSPSDIEEFASLITVKED